MTGVPEAVSAAQEIAAEVSPAPVSFERVASADELKARLNWGKPALTILDVRDRQSFNDERITGAVLAPPEKVVSQVSQMLEANRDIYVYGHTNEDAVAAANQLDQAGYNRVSILSDGLSAWKSAHGPTEGRRA